MNQQWVFYFPLFLVAVADASFQRLEV